MADKHHIPRVSKVDDDINQALPLPTDTMSSSFWRRVVATFIDIGIVIFMAVFVISPLVHSSYYSLTLSEMFYSYLRWVALITFLFWATYVTLLNASRWRATLGQKLLRIQVVSVFGERISYIKALGRFIIFSAPTVILFAGALEEIFSVLPFGVFPAYDVVRTEVNITENFYILVLLVSLGQLMLIWSMLTANHSRVLWDYIWKTRVLLNTPRDL